jgi:hypothetical protein
MTSRRRVSAADATGNAFFGGPLYEFCSAPSWLSRVAGRSLCERQAVWRLFRLTGPNLAFFRLFSPLLAQAAPRMSGAHFSHFVRPQGGRRASRDPHGVTVLLMARFATVLMGWFRCLWFCGLFYNCPLDTDQAIAEIMRCLKETAIHMINAI